MPHFGPSEKLFQNNLTVFVISYCIQNALKKYYPYDEHMTKTTRLFENWLRNINK